MAILAARANVIALMNRVNSAAFDDSRCVSTSLNYIAVMVPVQASALSSFDRLRRRYAARGPFVDRILPPA